MRDNPLCDRIFWHHQGGAVGSEYAILIACLALAIMAAVTVLRGAVHLLFQTAVDKLPK